MKTSKPVLFDTNILVYNQDIESEFYNMSCLYHEKVYRGEMQAAISCQNIVEFTAVITSKKRVPHPLTPPQASQEIQKYLYSNLFILIYPNRDTISLYLKLIKKYPPNKPQKMYDLFLAATMLSNDVDTILTYNTKDFQFKEIKVLSL